jgi:hypothetical protein
VSSESSIQEIIAGQRFVGRFMPDDVTSAPVEISASPTSSIRIIDNANVCIVGLISAGATIGALTDLITQMGENFSISTDFGASDVALTPRGEKVRPPVRFGIAKSSATPSPAIEEKTAFSMCRNLLFSRRGLLHKDQYWALERQLRSLFVEEGEPISSAVASPVSFDGLINFLAQHRPTHPNISLNRDGQFVASWPQGKRAKLSLTFDRAGGDWVAINLDVSPPLRRSGSFVKGSLTGISEPFRNWIAA